LGNWRNASECLPGLIIRRWDEQLIPFCIIDGGTLSSTIISISTFQYVLLEFFSLPTRIDDRCEWFKIPTTVGSPKRSRRQKTNVMKPA
jgi:hypothetical protein